MNKKTFIIVAAILVICIIAVVVYLACAKANKPQENEIQPQEEISDEQMRQTIVTLYYQSKETKELMPEGRMVDSKTLLTDPYATLISLLIEGPKNEQLQSVIPQGTRVLKAELKGDIVYIDLSKEFIDNHSGGQEAENTTIYSIVNTLTELNEVNSVKILINGREDQSFKDNKINFKNAFIRVDHKNTSKDSSKESNTNSINNSKTTNTLNNTSSTKTTNTANKN